MSPGLNRRVRRTGGRFIRQWGLLPEGDPDGLGDDDALRGTSLPFAVMVYFPDVVRNLYQLRQWYGTLQHLNERHRVGVVCLDSRVAAVLREECDLPVLCCGRIGTLEDMVSRSDVALALYVNHNVRNLHPLRFVTMLHAYLGHGDSDKISSASNQVKAYDFALVAGEAGRERLRRNLLRYDADAHVRTVGRPQLDALPARPATRARSTRAEPDVDRPTVLYAPTWEGAQPSMAYSSVVSHGLPLLTSLFASGKFNVVYRPHPRTGANRADYAAADQRLRALVLQHQKTDLPARHEIDLSPTWDARHDPADVLVSDISAVASDWMTTGKPLVVTVPAAPEAYLDGDTVLSAVPGLAGADADRAADLVSAQLAVDDAVRRESWVQHTMGDVTPGASMARFLAVCDELITLRGQELQARAARLTGPRQ